MSRDATHETTNAMQSLVDLFKNMMPEELEAVLKRAESEEQSI